MLKYLVILLDRASVSYCHYRNAETRREPIPIETLKAGILFAMKENLTVQFVYPDYDLPAAHKEAVETVSHSKIVPEGHQGKAEVVVLQGWNREGKRPLESGTAYILRTSKEALFQHYGEIPRLLSQADRLSVVITDVETCTAADFERYGRILRELANDIEALYRKGRTPQLNLLTDRIVLDAMNNCNAGWEHITLAPNGKFYVCPAFYYTEGRQEIGDVERGMELRNAALYRLDHAPLCRRCDAYQCRRCVYLDHKTTLEVNTPSHEQCVAAHLERNASRALLEGKTFGTLFPDRKIEEIDYLDPFEARKEW